MAKKEKSGKPHKRPIEQYDHKGKKRVNNPPVGLVNLNSDPPAPTHRTYDYIQPVPSVRPGENLDYDPHLDPQLVWAGKKEHTSFEVPTVSLHVHERIDPRTIIEAVRKRNGNGRMIQGSLFETKEENPPLRDAIDFYKHAHNWSNRLIAGDSLLVMNSLLEKEGMSGHVQMVYIDPPYGIKYGSNFQPFVNRRDVKDAKDEDLTQEPEMVRAFRDTWELGIHSYLTYFRDRLLLARELLHESGSCFVQISDENLHRVRDVMDEVFGADNFCAVIPFIKTSGLSDRLLSGVADFLLWYAKDRKLVKYRQLFESKILGREGTSQYTWIESADRKNARPMREEEIANPEKIPEGWRVFSRGDLRSQGSPTEPQNPFRWRGTDFVLPPNSHWKTTIEGLERLAAADRLVLVGTTLMYKRYLQDFPVFPRNNVWLDTVITGFSERKLYVVQSSARVPGRCILMTTDPGDLVLDPTCGGGTTAYVAEQWGRRWITCDTSRIAITLAKQRLMSALYDYYELAHSSEGIDSGFRYETVPHITLKSIANDELPAPETLYDRPLVDGGKVRVTGPFTVEAVPAPTVQPVDEIDLAPRPADVSVSRSGPTLRDAEWREELLKTGIRGKGGQTINFSRVEPLGGTRWLHADAETKGAKPDRVAISFGPEYAPLIGTQVESAWQEARTLIPRPSIIVFAAFQFDPQAAKDIDELTKEKTGMTFLTAQMNPDLLTEDLKKKRASNQSFWLIGRPDVELRPIKDGEHKGKWQAEVRGFDYFNTRTGTIESGDTSKIAMWLLDTDYDGRSLYPRQVFFPLADDDGGWARLTKNLKAEIDPELIEAYRGTVSLPFESGEHKRIAVKVIDDRGIESLKVLAFD
jgi:adenine-specific DNA-methyltransferase